MASQTRPRASEEERRHKIRTLVVATVASGTAAVVTSQFWIAGTWVAAAVTPVLVTLISELLNRPTAAIATRLTSERDALPPKPTRSEELLDEEPARAPAEAPVNVYRSGGGGRPRPAARKKIAVGAVLAVAALAFAISAVAITGTELITGGSIGKGGDRITPIAGGRDDEQKDESRDTTTPTDQDRQQDTDQDQQTTEQTTPETDQQTAPEEQDTEQTVPEQTAPAPRSAPPTSTSP